MIYIPFIELLYCLLLLLLLLLATSYYLLLLPHTTPLLLPTTTEVLVLKYPFFFLIFNFKFLLIKLFHTLCVTHVKLPIDR